MGPGSDGPMGGLGGMESHHMNGSLGKALLLHWMDRMNTLDVWNE